LLVELDPTGGDPTRRPRDQSQYGEGAHRLAAAGFSDHCNGLTGEDIEADVVHGTYSAFRRCEFDTEIGHGQDRLTAE